MHTSNVQHASVRYGGMTSPCSIPCHPHSLQASYGVLQVGSRGLSRGLSHMTLQHDLLGGCMDSVRMKGGFWKSPSKYTLKHQIQ